MDRVVTYNVRSFIPVKLLQKGENWTDCGRWLLYHYYYWPNILRQGWRLYTLSHLKRETATRRTTTTTPMKMTPTPMMTAKYFISSPHFSSVYFGQALTTTSQGAPTHLPTTPTTNRRGMMIKMHQFTQACSSRLVHWLTRSKWLQDSFRRLERSWSIHIWFHWSRIFFKFLNFFIFQFLYFQKYKQNTCACNSTCVCCCFNLYSNCDALCFEQILGPMSCGNWP